MRITGEISARAGVSIIAVFVGGILSLLPGAGVHAAATLETESPPCPARANARQPALPAENAGNIVVYINWDGFAKYYVDLAEAQGKIPTLSRIKNEDGVFFTNAYSGIPSVTNPMQAALASGTTPRFTDNHYRYFDKNLNRVVQEQPARKNEAETLAEAAVRQGVEAFSIHQFAFLNRGTESGGEEKTYFTAPAGPNGYSDSIARFDEAVRFIRARAFAHACTHARVWAETMNPGGEPEQEDPPSPFLLALYMDDLDAAGHNMEEARARARECGLAPVGTEAERRQAVVDRLAVMDGKLAEFIQACREAGLYERMSFLLTTDHGMASMGLQQSLLDDSIESRLPDLLSLIEAAGPGYKCEVLSPGGKATPEKETDIAVVTLGLQVQLSYINEYNPGVIEDKNAKIAEVLQDTVYVDRIMFPREMRARGVKPGFADLIISPKPPYHFRASGGGLTIVRAQHDSLAEEAQRIAAFMWGKNIKKGFAYTGIVENIDFAPTMAKLLGINAPLDATGRVLYEVLEDIPLPRESMLKVDDLAGFAGETVNRCQDRVTSGGTAVNTGHMFTSLKLVNVPAANSMTIEYAAGSDSRFLLYVNDRFVRRVFFPATGGLGSKYDQKRINLTLNQGDTARFVSEKTGGGGIIINCVILQRNLTQNSCQAVQSHTAGSAQAGSRAREPADDEEFSLQY